MKKKPKREIQRRKKSGKNRGESMNKPTIVATGEKITLGHIADVKMPRASGESTERKAEKAPQTSRRLEEKDERKKRRR